MNDQELQQHRLEQEREDSRRRYRLVCIKQLLESEGGRDKFATSLAEVLRRKPEATRFAITETRIEETIEALGSEYEQRLRDVFEVAKTRI